MSSAQSLGRPDVGNTGGDMKPAAQTRASSSQTQNSLINVVGLVASIFAEVASVERQSEDVQ